jgi:hypothetical protein
MLRRLATLLLTLNVTFAGLLAMPHAAACCIVRQAPAHDCCKATTQLHTSDCCRGNQQLTDRVVQTQHAPQQSLPAALVDPLVRTVPPAIATIVAAPLTRGLAPPGSLIAQHTSLLL